MLARAQIKINIFELAKAVTCYDESKDDRDFATDVKTRLEVIDRELAEFFVWQGFRKEVGVQADRQTCFKASELVQSVVSRI